MQAITEGTAHKSCSVEMNGIAKERSSIRKRMNRSPASTVFFLLLLLLLFSNEKKNIQPKAWDWNFDHNKFTCLQGLVAFRGNTYIHTHTYKYI